MIYHDYEDDYYDGMDELERMTQWGLEGFGE